MSHRDGLHLRANERRTKRDPSDPLNENYAMSRGDRVGLANLQYCSLRNRYTMEIQRQEIQKALF